MKDMERRRATRRQESKKREAEETYRETVSFALKTLDHQKIAKRRIEQFLQDTLNEQATPAKLLSTTT